jgi:hypothetical protein
MEVYHFLQCFLWFITIQDVSCFLFPSFHSFKLGKTSISSRFVKSSKSTEKKFEFRKSQQQQQQILFSSTNPDTPPDLFKKSFSSPSSIKFPAFTPPTPEESASISHRHDAIQPLINPMHKQYNEYNQAEMEYIKMKIADIYSNPYIFADHHPPVNQEDAHFFGTILAEIGKNFGISNQQALSSFIQHVPWLMSHNVPG